MFSFASRKEKEPIGLFLSKLDQAVNKIEWIDGAEGTETAKITTTVCLYLSMFSYWKGVDN